MVVEKNPAIYFDPIDTASLQPANERKVADSILNLLRADDAFWYANALIKKDKATGEQTSLLMRLIQQQWVRSLLWGLISVLFVAVLLWYLASLNIRLFRKKATAMNIDVEEAMPQDIFSIDYKMEIDKAIKEKNFRLAVRLHYLDVLAKMAQGGIIQYGQERTNSQYLEQLYNTGYYKEFFRLTRTFEYAWYGQFAVTPAAFTILQHDFATFNQRLQF